MFSKETYIKRRNELKSKFSTGILFFPGNEESPMNYADNTYHFRQDSTFLYYFGIDMPGLAAVIDAGSSEVIVFGNELTVEEIVWMGAQETISQKAAKAGIANTRPLDDLEAYLGNAQKEKKEILFIPQYRAENLLRLEKLLNVPAGKINEHASVGLIKAIAEQRSIKTDEEIAEIEKALNISYEMVTAAMKAVKDGMIEREAAGLMQGIAASMGSGLSFPTIFSIHGEILHNHAHANVMKNGDLIVCDSGAETDLHYASDITRTFPVSGKFSDRQKAVYEIVLKANVECAKAVKPGIKHKEVHMLAARIITDGLKSLGLLKGDTEAIIEAGAHALFFPHGLGHLLGLDVHDLENLGEKYTGYDETIERSTQFGLRSLRFGKELKPGMVLTDEPGIYFIPELISQWEAEGRHREFINYEAARSYIGFGGIRIEDDVLVTESGSRVLGKPIPKTVEEIESIMNK